MVKANGSSRETSERLTGKSARRSDTHEYPVLIEPLPSEEGGGYVATVPDLPGCMSDGETSEEALANVHDAIDAWKASALAIGHPIPGPTRLRQYA